MCGALQDCFEMILTHAKEIHDLKQARRKTDKRDCEKVVMF
jgi:hypothetical protein